MNEEEEYDDNIRSEHGAKGLWFVFQIYFFKKNLWKMIYNFAKTNIK